MFDDFIEFKKVFNEVKKKGWVKSLRKGDTGVGFTFESLIGKEEENFPIADYGSIEIKTTRMYSRKRIHLFSAVPDGDYLFPIKRVLDKVEYVENLQQLIENNGNNFKLTEEELELANMLT